MDAAEWIEREFGRPASTGLCRMLLHTIVWQYLPDETQSRIEAVLAREAGAATADSPLARLSMEPDALSPDADMGAALTLTIWPGGESLALGRGDFHGRWARWAEV
jgi:hypothetical protein